MHYEVTNMFNTHDIMCRLFVTLNSKVVATGFILQTDTATIQGVEMGTNIV